MPILYVFMVVKQIKIPCVYASHKVEVGDHRVINSQCVLKNDMKKVGNDMQEL